MSIQNNPSDRNFTGSSALQSITTLRPVASKKPIHGLWSLYRDITSSLLLIHCFPDLQNPLFSALLLGHAVERIMGLPEHSG